MYLLEQNILPIENYDFLFTCLVKSTDLACKDHARNSNDENDNQLGNSRWYIHLFYMFQILCFN